MSVPKPGIYKHFKGNHYEVLFCATHSETEEEMIVYKPVNSARIWVRPLSSWTSPAEVEGEKVERFQLIDLFGE